MSSPAAYVCVTCSEPLEFARVASLQIHKQSKGMPTSFLITYECACSTELRRVVYPSSVSALRHLFGTLTPTLPYYAAPGPLSTLTRRDQRIQREHEAEIERVAFPFHMFPEEVGHADD